MNRKGERKVRLICTMCGEPMGLVPEEKKDDYSDECLSCSIIIGDGEIIDSEHGG